ncbi:MAG: hypothetical protein HYX65_08290 [Gemmatimonadetes bacterium]|nr:hypothetical protein [Gemmatimonadota bacterium]
MQVDTSFRFQMELDANALTYFVAFVQYASRPAAANADGDFQYKVDVRFQRLGRDPTAAAAALTLSGQVESAPKQIYGTNLVGANGQGSWAVTAGTYNTRLYRIRWFLDNNGPLNTYLNSDSVFAGGVGPSPGVHQVKALLMLADSVVGTARYDFQVQANASIAGPVSISESGYYTWSAADPGTTGPTPTYAWQLYDATLATWAGIGSGSSVTIPVNSSGPSRDFILRLDVSAAGYVSNNASIQVTNYLVGDCGGNACLRGLPSARRTPPPLAGSSRRP